MEITVREATTEDRANIFELLKKPEVQTHLPPTPPITSLNSMYRSAEALKARMLVKEIDGKFAGFSFIYIRGSEAWLSAINAPEYQNQGASKEAIAYIVAHASEWGISELKAIVNPSNKAVIGLLESQGFTSPDNRIFTRALEE